MTTGFGITSPIPTLVGFPKGKIRIRQKNDDFVRIFIKSKNGIICTIPKNKNGKWYYDSQMTQAKTIRK